MEETFYDQLADQYFAIVDHFMPPEVYQGIKDFLESLIETDRLRRAGIGAMAQFELNKAIRGDQIFWLQDDKANPAIRFFLEKMNRIVTKLNSEFYLSLSDSEFHFARFPAGSFYRRHLDQFKGRNNRQISVILYLNDGWKIGDGGELKMYLPNGELVIEPLGNRFVAFKSDSIPHEVLETKVDRSSLTGWLLNNPAGLGFLG